jgi:large repetitive protein
MELSKEAFDCSNVGANIVTLTVWDVNGNYASATATVTVIDNILPTALCQNVTLYLDASGNTSTTAAAVDNNSFDNCDILSLVLSLTAFDCSHVGFNTVTLTVTDVNNNINTCTAQIEVIDNIKPTALCQDLTLYLDASGATSTTAAAVDNGSFDNCDILSLVLSQTAFDCNHLGFNTVTLLVTDVNSNTNTCTAQIEVIDNLKPIVITKPHTVYLDANGVTSMVALDINDNSTDNCTIVSYDIDIETFDCFDVGPVTVTLTVTDQSGNTNTGTAIVTVVDNLPPTVVTQDITVYLDANGTVTITAMDIDNVSTDNCDIDTYVLDQYTFTCAHVGTNTVTLTVTDVNGNAASATATVTVVDNIFPTITCATPVNPYKVNSGCEYVVPGTDLDATGWDNCTYTLTHNYMTSMATTLQGAAFPIGTTTVVWTIEDASGNSATCTSTIIVKGFTVSGNINYYNRPQTIMNGVAVTLTGPATYTPRPMRMVTMR